MDGIEESFETLCATLSLYHISLPLYTYIQNTLDEIYIAHSEHKNAKARDQARAFFGTTE
jgi:hypothetical protein